jgi:hypothetical protein
MRVECHVMGEDTAERERLRLAEHVDERVIPCGFRTSPKNTMQFSIGSFRDFAASLWRTLRIGGPFIWHRLCSQGSRCIILFTMSALGVPVELDRDAKLTRFQFYLGLADALNCRQHAQSGHLKELAESFSHDILNLAALAGRLLWYEGVTSEMWRSHDLIAVSVDLESYYVMLQSACDIMADIIVTIGVAKKGQAPWESFHKLNEWALKNPGRLDPSYHMVAAELPWFRQLNSTRTGVVHRGKKMLVYTDRVTFNWGKLLPKLRDLTRAVLDFSEQLSKVVLSEPDRQNCQKKTVIDGVYVPALHHLLFDYTVPQVSERLKPAANCLIACGGYVEAGYIGYPNGFWWELLTCTSQELKSDVVSASIPVNVGGTVQDCRFVLSDGNKTYGLVACDHGNAGAAWLKGAAESATNLQSKSGADRVVLVVRDMKGRTPEFLPESQVPIITGSMQDAITHKVVKALRS